MKKATLILWAIIFGVIALLIFQNQSFFMTNQSLRVNLGIIEEYHTPELPIAVMVLVFFVVGVIIAYLFNISARFKAKRTIKKLNATIATHNEEVAGLRRELDSLKGIETPAGEETTEIKSEMDKTQKIESDGSADSPDEQTGAFSIDKEEDNPSEKKEE
jgi:uncharacterized integral membrane protein